jgi:hypothetical protein
MMVVSRNNDGHRVIVAVHVTTQLRQQKLCEGCATEDP